MDVTKNEDALLSIGGLARACGITAETLRNWERRYGFPEPVRRSSGHRRYHWGIVPRLQLIRRALELGYKPSFAVAASVEKLAEAIEQTPGARSSGLHATIRGAADEIESWLAAVERFDTTGLDLVLRRAWSRHGAAEFVLDLAIPFLREIGDRWEDGRLNVAHEHFASETLVSFLGQQWRPLSRRARGSRVVLANLEGELHNLGLHMAAVFLSLADIEVVLLGPNTPLDDIQLAAAQPGVTAVVIGLSPVADPVASALKLTRLRDALSGSVLVAFGGNADVADIEGIMYFETLESLSAWAALGDQTTSTAGR